MFSFNNWLVEINMSQAKKATEIFLSSGGKKRYEEIFNGQDRIYYDFKNKKEVDSLVMYDVAEALHKEKYVLLDYIQGLCYSEKDPKRKLKVQRILFSIGKESLAQKMNNDPIRDSSKTSGMKVVFSRHGIDIAGQSTDRDWTSCKELTSGVNSRYVWSEISAGVIVAYLIDSKDLNIKKPIARLTLGVFKLKNNPSTVAFFPTSAVYGNYRDPSFYDFVVDWCVETNEKLNSLPGTYFLDPACHTDFVGDLTVINGYQNLSVYLDTLINRATGNEITIKKRELDLESFLEIFDAISKLPSDKASKVLNRLNLESFQVAELLEKADIKDIARMQDEHPSSLSTFLGLSEKHWSEISDKRKREIYDIYENAAGKTEMEEILSHSISVGSKFLKLEYAKKYK
jgi:hypothetical protein